MCSAGEEELGQMPGSSQASKSWPALTQTIVLSQADAGPCPRCGHAHLCAFALALTSLPELPSALLFSASIGHATNTFWTQFVVQHWARYCGSRKINLIWPRLSRSLFPGKGDGACAQVILVANMQGEWNECLIEWLGEYGERRNPLWQKGVRKAWWRGWHFVEASIKVSGDEDWHKVMWNWLDWLGWVCRPNRSRKGSEGTVQRKGSNVYWAPTMCKSICLHIVYITALRRFYYSCFVGGKTELQRN